MGLAFKNPAFLKRFVIFIVAAVVLIGSILPTVSYKIEYFKEETVSIKISPLRSITLMFDSFVNHDAEELADSLFAETSEAKMEIWSELLGRVDKDDLTARQKNIVAKCSSWSREER